MSDAPKSSRNALPYYKRYPRDLIEGTMGLSFEEKAAYAFVLDLIYLQNGRLPDDPRYIAGLLNLSVRKWNSIRGSLIEKGKLVVISGLLSNYRAIIELESLRKYQEQQAENRRGPNENNDLEKPTLNDGPTNQNQNQIYGGGGGSAGAREAENQPPESNPEPTFRSKILEAIGADPVSGLIGPNGRQLGTQTDMIEAGRWLSDLGLTEAECLAEISQMVRAKRDGPPKSFRFFTQAMTRLAGIKAAEPLKPTEITHDPAVSNTVQFPRAPRGGRSGTSLADVAARLIAEERGEG